MMNRSSILSLLLVAANIAVVVKTYVLWQEGPWDIPQVAQKATAADAVEEKKEAVPGQLAMTAKNIIDNNLFDPERGASNNKDNEAAAAATKKIRSMVLTGTVILGESRFALFQESSEAKSQTGGAGTTRLKLGDVVEGFQLSQIEEKRVAFTKGDANVEIALDFFRKVDGIKEAAGSSRAPSQPPPPASRRDRLPPPPRP